MTHKRGDVFLSMYAVLFARYVYFPFTKLPGYKYQNICQSLWYINPCTGYLPPFPFQPANQRSLRSARDSSGYPAGRAPGDACGDDEPAHKPLP